MVTSLLKSLIFNYGVIWKKHTRLSCCQSPKLALFFEARKRWRVCSAFLKDVPGWREKRCLRRPRVQADYHSAFKELQSQGNERNIESSWQAKQWFDWRVYLELLHHIILPYIAILYNTANSDVAWFLKQRILYTYTIQLCLTQTRISIEEY